MASSDFATSLASILDPSAVIDGVVNATSDDLPSDAVTTVTLTQSTEISMDLPSSVSAKQMETALQTVVCAAEAECTVEEIRTRRSLRRLAHTTLTGSYMLARRLSGIAIAQAVGFSSSAR